MADGRKKKRKSLDEGKQERERRKESHWTKGKRREREERKVIG